jgi:exodeoxyribonuclease V alpha subunit
MNFRVGDRIIQLKNDYKREVFNGDLGIIAAIDAGE